MGLEADCLFSRFELYRRIRQIWPESRYKCVIWILRSDLEPDEEEINIFSYPAWFATVLK